MKAFNISSVPLKALIGVFLLIWGCSGWTYVPVTDSNLISSADSIVLGSIKSRVDGSEAGVRGPWTHYEVEVVHSLKSSEILKRRLSKKRDAQYESIVVSVIGGYNPETNQTLFVPAAPSYEEGDRVLLFLSHDKSDGNEINQLANFALGSFQKLEIVTDLNAPVATNEHDKDYVLVRNFDMAQLEKKDMHLDARKYGEFVRYIVRESSLGDDDDQKSFRRPDYWTKVSSDSLVPQSKARFNTFKYQQKPIRWRTFDEEKSVVWLRNAAQKGLEGGAVDEFKSGLDAWNDQPNTPISYVEGGETSVQSAFLGPDGINTIVFEDPKNVITGKYQCGVGGTLALGGWWTTGKVYDFRGISFSELVEADIVVQDGIECWFKDTKNPSASYANLMTHELGHTLGLDHSCGDTNQKCSAGSTAEAAVMRSYVHNNAGAFLADDDNLGIEYIYSECYPNCVPSNVTYEHEEEELQQESSEDMTFLGLSEKHSLVVGCVTIFVLLAVIAIVVAVVVKRKRRHQYETGRSRSSSLIIDPYDNIDISTYRNGPQGYISPTRLSYFDHFAAVSNLQQQQMMQQQQQQQNSVSSPYKASRPLSVSADGIHTSKIPLDDQN